MAGALQADTTSKAGTLDHRVPLLEGQRHDKVADKIEVPRHLHGLTADVQPVGILQH
ncbi:hypothetical protein D3C76_1781420 [compost metagenome]